jgi:prophage maintenance system killer protein
MTNSDQVVVFNTENAALEVQLHEDTVWLNRKQLSELFDRDIKTIGKHISNVFSEGELDKDSTVAKYATVQYEGAREVTRDVEHYNLDVIISVGYRVKSIKGTEFRKWANGILKDYLVKGYAVNKKRLEEATHKLDELKRVIEIQERVVKGYDIFNDETKDLIDIIASYSSALDMLDDYDHQRLQLPERGCTDVQEISYAEAREAIDELGRQTDFEGLFGKEKDDSFKGSIENIYQTFGGIDLYPTTEEKAANLLYFIVKNHSFTDGNKRIAAFIFVWFLDRNNLIYKTDGTKVISDNTLISLTLMIAESKSDDKDMIIKVVVNLLLNYES